MLSERHQTPAASVRNGVHARGKRERRQRWSIFWAALICTFAIGPNGASAGVPVKPIVTAISSLTRHAEALADEDIVRLAHIAGQPGGTKTVGKTLGAQNLPNEVLEDTYLRIAIQQQRLPRQEAEGMYQRLSGTPGFRTTLRKTVGNSSVKTSGHLNELRIADTAAQHGFNVRGIGIPFNDGKKAADTDIDVLLEKKGRLIAIEAKDYAATTPLPMDGFRADMVSLTEYVASKPEGAVIPIFSVTNKPSNASTWRLLQLEADRRDIQLIVGSTAAQIEQIKILWEIL